MNLITGQNSSNFTLICLIHTIMCSFTYTLKCILLKLSFNSATVQRLLEQRFILLVNSDWTHGLTMMKTLQVVYMQRDLFSLITQKSAEVKAWFILAVVVHRCHAPKMANAQAHNASQWDALWACRSAICDVNAQLSINRALYVVVIISFTVLYVLCNLADWWWACSHIL
jgi:hypothetical protein